MLLIPPPTLSMLLLRFVALLLPLSALAAPALSPRAINPETSQALNTGQALAQASIKATDFSAARNPPPPLSASSMFWAVYSYGRPRGPLGFLVVPVHPAEMARGDVQKLSVFAYRPASTMGRVRAQYTGMGSYGQLVQKALPGLRIEGWMWYGTLFREVLGVVEVGAGPSEEEDFYQEVMRQLGAKEGWVPLQ